MLMLDLDGANVHNLDITTTEIKNVISQLDSDAHEDLLEKLGSAHDDIANDEQQVTYIVLRVVRPME